jgi:glycogen operon protein
VTDNDYGTAVSANGVRFSVRAPQATAVWLCLFDGDNETRLSMVRDEETCSLFVPGVTEGTRYGFRASGPYAPERGLWFDPDKLLMDPWATRIDSQWRYDSRLTLPPGQSIDTAPIVPKAMVEAPKPVDGAPVMFRHGGLIYELNLRSFSMLHPDVPDADRGTLAALRHPSVIAHFKRIGVGAVELMPVTAWIDERHLSPLGLTNAWGYNPVTLMALDPRFAPNGIADLAETTAGLRAHGIGVILDLVYNHTGESDRHGPTLSLRGLDNLSAYRHLPDQPGTLVNDTGCGNTIDCAHPAMREMILGALRHFVRNGGVDGFRFDLAPILGRDAKGFSAQAQTLQAIANDRVLADRVLIAEPWDVGPGGYQLGKFPEPFLEWNDRYRDTVRRFWRRDAGTLADLATVQSGSSDIFAGARTRSVNFIAAHDGFTLADIVSYEHKHNAANGEDNRDGHNENLSWNNGAEGKTTEPGIINARRNDIIALLTTLFLSRGSIMITAGDEFGRSQHGNNNAYCQDNPDFWLDWNNRDPEIEECVAQLAALRRRLPNLQKTSWFSGKAGDDGLNDIQWLTSAGLTMTPSDWNSNLADTLLVVIATGHAHSPQMAILINRAHEPRKFALPQKEGWLWDFEDNAVSGTGLEFPARSVCLLGQIKAQPTA